MKEIQDRIDVIRSKKEELDDIMKKQNNIQDNIIRITQHDTQQSALPQQVEIIDRFFIDFLQTH